MHRLLKLDIFVMHLMNMADRHSKEQRHYNMSRIKGRNTKPEIVVRSRLFADGFRFRVNVRTLPGTPDIVLPKYHTVIFVNGCFWHGHDGCRYYVVPDTNRNFWTEKIHRNRERDRVACEKLESQGWNVIVIWECDLKKAVIEETMTAVISKLKENL